MDIIDWNEFELVTRPVINFPKMLYEFIPDPENGALERMRMLDLLCRTVDWIIERADSLYPYQGVIVPTQISHVVYQHIHTELTKRRVYQLQFNVYVKLPFMAITQMQTRGRVIFGDGMSYVSISCVGGPIIYLSDIRALYWIHPDAAHTAGNPPSYAAFDASNH